MSKLDSDGIRRVSAELDALPNDTRRFISVYAYVLARVARTDPGLTDAERAFMERTVIETGGLSEPQAALVVQVAHTMGVLYGATEDYVVTREFARVATPEQCRSLLRAACALSAADGTVSASELAELGEIGAELGLDGEVVAAIRDEVLGAAGIESRARRDED